MNPQEIFEKIPDLQKNFSDLHKQKKQMKALENHAQIKAFNENEQKVFHAIGYCMKGAFLQDEDADWISRKLDRLHINYLDWAHKTKWLKQKIDAEKPAIKPSIVQSTIFDFIPKTIPFNIPTEILSVSQSAKLAARAQ